MVKSKGSLKASTAPGRLRSKGGTPAPLQDQRVLIQDYGIALLLPSVALFTTIADLTAEHGQGPGLYHTETH